MPLKLKNIITIAVAAAVSAALLSCQDSLGIEDNVNVIPEDAFIKPLEVGNEWTYLITKFDSSGRTVVESNIKFTIVEEKTIDNETWYVEKQGTTTPDITVTLANRRDGLWRRNGSSQYMPNSPFKLVSYPVLIGEEYKVNQYDDIQDGTMEIFRKVLGVKNRIKVKAGAFYCCKYSDRKQKLGGGILCDPLNILFYAPNTGLIKLERYKITYSGDIYLSESQELIKVILK